MGRRILLITTDQQRYDTLGCNGGALARTPEWAKPIMAAALKASAAAQPG